MMRFVVLGSGSSGNAAVLESGGKRILIDAGLSAKQLSARLEMVGICSNSIDAILLTHEHGDHIGGLDVFLKTRDIPVFTNAMTREAFAYKLTRCRPKWHMFENEQSFELGAIKVIPIPLLHDAADPVGFRFETADHSIAYLSDLGFANAPVKAALKDVDLAYLEANYDDDLLMDDTKRPHSTKQRIMGRHGHLSNSQAASLVEEVCCARLKHLILGHLSSDCNDAELAIAAVRQGLSGKKLRANLLCSSPFEPSPWIELESASRKAPENSTLRHEQPEFLF